MIQTTATENNMRDPAEGGDPSGLQRPAGTPLQGLCPFGRNPGSPPEARAQVVTGDSNCLVTASGASDFIFSLGILHQAGVLLPILDIRDLISASSV